MIRDVIAMGEMERCLLLELTPDDIGEYFKILVTVCAKSRVGGDAVLVEDAKGTEGLVASVLIATRGFYIQFSRRDDAYATHSAKANEWKVFNQPWSA